jgi:hypothetical protein
MISDDVKGPIVIDTEFFYRHFKKIGHCQQPTPLCLSGQACRQGAWGLLVGAVDFIKSK